MERNVKSLSNEICCKGYIIFNRGMHMDSQRIKVIEEGSQPKNLHKERRRLSFNESQKKM